MKSALTILFLFLNIGNILGQGKVFRDGFENNRNGWETNTKTIGENAKISAGRYNIEITDKNNWHHFTLPIGVKSDNYLIEALITKIPRSATYQKINIEEARRLLPSKNYKKKYHKLISAGLIEFDNIQKRGGRVDFSSSGSYRFLYLGQSNPVTDNTSSAAGYIASDLQRFTYDDSSYGLIWGMGSTNNLFAFSIVPEQGQFNVVSVINGVVTSIIDWTTSYAIKKGNATNKLSVMNVDGDLHFLINEQRVGTAFSQQFFGNNIGFILGPETNISIDFIDYVAK